MMGSGTSEELVGVDFGCRETLGGMVGEWFVDALV